MDNIQERVQSLTETRARVWEEAKGFLEDMGKGEEMNAEQRAQWDRYNERIDSLAAEADSLLDRNRRETEAAAVRAAQTEAFGREPDPEPEQNWNQRIRDWAAGRTRMDGQDQDGSFNGFRTNVTRVMRERDLARAGASPEEIRALAWDTGSSASTVPTLFDRMLYEVLEEEIAALRMPATRIVTDSGASMEFPINSTHGIATQVSGQGTTLAGTDPAFSKLTLTPVKYAQLVSVANEVISDSGIDMAGFLARDIGRAVGRQVNAALITSMVGAVTVGSGGTVATGGTLLTPDYEDLVNLMYSVNDSYRNQNAAWLMRDSTAGTIRKLRDGAGGTEGAPIWQPMVTGGVSGYRQPDLLLGYPVYTDPGVASMASNAKTVFFGDWSAFYVRLVGDPVVERNDSVLFTTDQAAFRGKWRAAGGYTDLTAVNLLKQSVS